MDAAEGQSGPRGVAGGEHERVVGTVRISWAFVVWRCSLRMTPLVHRQRIGAWHSTGSPAASRQVSYGMRRCTSNLQIRLLFEAIGDLSLRKSRDVEIFQIVFHCHSQ
jgi:hypothetical protein